MKIKPTKSRKSARRNIWTLTTDTKLEQKKDGGKLPFSLLWLPNMDPFSTAPGFILDLIFLKLNEEDLHETLRVSKSWFWASIRRTKKLKITSAVNPLKSIAEFYKNHRPPNEKMDYLDLFEHLVLDELIVIGDKQTTNYLINNGCNTAELKIQTFGEGEIQVTLGSLKTITRLQSLEYCINSNMKWHPFIIDCFKSSDCEFDPNIKCPIEAIKLKSSGWNTEDPVLQSVTKLSVWRMTIDFLRTMVDHCPNLEELHCTSGRITQEWCQVFPANVKRIELHDCYVDDDVATDVNVSTDAGRQLLPYLCQNWEAVEKFHFDYSVFYNSRTVYEAFPKQREEVFVCRIFNEEMNLASPHFQSRKIHVGCLYWLDALEFIIPSTKSVKLDLKAWRDFKFSPRDVCLEPGKVEDLALTLITLERVPVEPFGPHSFEGLSRLTSLALSNCSTLSIKMALDQCPSIIKLKLKNLNKSTLGSMPKRSSFANVRRLLLDECEEPMHQVFQVFPCLTKLKQLGFRNVEIREETTELKRHLIEENQKFGFVFESKAEIRFMVSDDLQASLNEAQKLLHRVLHRKSGCYLKGFKLLPRFATQKLIYIN